VAEDVVSPDVPTPDVDERTAWLTPGGTLPDLELPDSTGGVRRLTDLVGGDPTLVHFYRGWFCPKERQFFQVLAALQDEAEVAYTRFVSISVEPPEVSSAYRAGLGARWTFLSDPERRYLDVLGLRETTDTVHDPYIPTCVVVDPDLTLHAAYRGYWFWGRPTAEELRQDFRSLTRSLRPDWDPPP